MSQLVIRLEPSEVRELLRIIAEMRVAYLDVERLLTEKLAAMKRSDTASLEQLGRAETASAARLAQLTTRQTEWRRAVARGRNLNARAIEGFTVSTLAAAVAPPERDRLTNASKELREVIERTQALSQRVGLIARTVVEHVSRVLGSVRVGEVRPAAYTPRGEVAAAGGSALLDAVG